MENLSTSVRAIQILSPVNHCFELKLNELENILNADDIKNRHVVVVSIVGAFRKGKSFLMNFFLKYLYAQYKKRDVSDWIGKHENDEQIGFKSRGGRKPETAGIWMWSEIFTHDDNLAIILLDTQGIFDNQSSVKDCTTIFALSTLLSSVQCFNLMQNIQEDDLQHLELFTEYGKLVIGQSNEKPFQKLIFIVRDWPHACETGYGWNGQQVIEEIIAEDSIQTSEMQQLRTQIKSNFEKITAFLLPFPGQTVAQGGYTGNLQQIDTEFIKYIEELVPDIFAPDKLIVKKINGQELRACDFVQFLESYTKIFNDDTLPEPKTVLMTTTETSYLILQNECLHIYVDYMQKSLDDTETYFDETELKNIHQNAMTGAMNKFLEKPKIGEKKLVAKFQRRFKKSVNDRFSVFKQKNDVKLEKFIVKAKQHNKNLIADIKMNLIKNACNEIENNHTHLTESRLQVLFENMRKTSLNQFEKKKIGNDDILNGFCEDLYIELDRFVTTVSEQFDVYEKSLVKYNDLMNKSEILKKFPTEHELSLSLEPTKKRIIAEFLANKKCDIHEIATSFERRLECQINNEFFKLKQERIDLINEINQHNQQLCMRLAAKFRNDMKAKLSILDLPLVFQNPLANSFYEMTKNMLHEFDLKRKGDAKLYDRFRKQLERDIDKVHIEEMLIYQKRDQKDKIQKPDRNDGILGGAAAGAAAGGMIGYRYGIVPAAVGTVLGALGGAAGVYSASDTTK